MSETDPSIRAAYVPIGDITSRFLISILPMENGVNRQSKLVSLFMLSSKQNFFDFLAVFYYIYITIVNIKG